MRVICERCKTDVESRRAELNHNHGGFLTTEDITVISGCAACLNDLLAACKLAHTTLQEIDIGYEDDWHASEIECLRKAIAKAEEKQP